MKENLIKLIEFIIKAFEKLIKFNIDLFTLSTRPLKGFCWICKCIGLTYFQVIHLSDIFDARDGQFRSFISYTMLQYF